MTGEYKLLIARAVSRHDRRANVVQLWLPSHIREHNLEPEVRDRVSGTEFEAMALVLCLLRFVRLQLIEQYDDRPNT